MNGWFTSKRYEGVFERNALYALDIGISKTFYKKLSCTVSFNDIFRSVNSRERFVINQVSSNGIYFDDGRELSIALKYVFGRIKGAKFKNRDVDESGSRLK